MPTTYRDLSASVGLTRFPQKRVFHEFASVARAPLPVWVWGRARLQSCRTSKKKIQAPRWPREQLKPGISRGQFTDDLKGHDFSRAVSNTNKFRHRKAASPH